MYAERDGRRAEGADAIGELTMTQWVDEEGRRAVRVLSGDDLTVVAEIGWPLWSETVWKWGWPSRWNRGRNGLHRLRRFRVTAYGSCEPREAGGRRRLRWLGDFGLDWTPKYADETDFVRSENLEHGIIKGLEALGVDRHDPAFEAAFDDACRAAWQPGSDAAKARGDRTARRSPERRMMARMQESIDRLESDVEDWRELATRRYAERGQVLSRVAMLEAAVAPKYREHGRCSHRAGRRPDGIRCLNAAMEDFGTCELHRADDLDIFTTAEELGLDLSAYPRDGHANGAMEDARPQGYANRTATQEDYEELVDLAGTLCLRALQVTDGQDPIILSLDHEYETGHGLPPRATGHKCACGLDDEDVAERNRKRGGPRERVVRKLKEHEGTIIAAAKANTAALDARIAEAGTIGGAGEVPE